MALGEKRNGSVFATAAQRRDAAEYQVTSEPEVVPVVVDDTPQRTLNTDIGTLGRAHSLFFTPSAEGRDFNSVLQEVQEYFVLGDHRESSVDSRSSLVGCVEQSEIVGKIIFRVWPLSSFGKIK